jgi:hypothetical protein
VCLPPPTTHPPTQSLHSYSPFTSYALSKLCNTMIAAEYQRRFDRHDPCTYGHDSAVAIHPGIVATSLATGFFTQVGAADSVGVLCGALCHMMSVLQH